MFPEYSLSPQGPVYVHRVQLMFPEYSLCLWSTFMSSEYSFSVPRVQFMSAEYSLCPQSTVSGSREQFMSLGYS